MKKNNKLQLISSDSWGRNFKWTMVGEVVGKGAVFVTNIILARELGTSGYGILAAAQAFAAYLWIVADLGVGFYGTREVARDNAQCSKIVSSLLGLRVLSGLVASCGGGFVALLLFDGVTAIAYAVAASQVMFLAMTIDWALRGLQQFRFLAIVSAVGGLVLVSGSIVVALLPGAVHDKVPLFLGVWAISQAAMAVISIVMLRHVLGDAISLSHIGWRNHLGSSLIFALSCGMVTAAQYFPVLALNHIIDSEATGVFSAPYRFVLSIITAIYMLTSSAYPILSKHHGNNQKHFTRQFVKMRNVVGIISCTIMVLIALLSDQIILFLFGDAYEVSGSVLLSLSPLVLLVSLRAIFGTALLASGGERLHLVASGLGLFLWVILGFPLISGFGISGAVWGCLMSELIVAVAMICFLRKIRG